MKEVLNICEKVNIPLAIENIDNQKIFIETFENIKHPMLKFCYDCGHNNVFDRDFDYFSNYNDKLITLHLHDNDGGSDLHTLRKLCSSTIDWEKIALNLKGHENINLDYEILNKNNSTLSIIEFLKEAFLQAQELENLIQRSEKY